MVRILGSPGRSRRLRSTIALTACALLLAVIAAPSALAVHDLEFQLDGDVVASTQTNIDGHPQTLDWDSLFDANGDEKTLPANFDASGFDKDFVNSGSTFVTSDTTTFATGSKDTLAITPGWQCNFDNNVNSKIDIMNAYAAAYTDPVTSHEILYFALERNTNTGDANVGFWFLQDDVNCSSTGGAAAFTGDHSDGDLLIVSAFTKGGDVSTIDVYRWDDPDGAGGSPGSLNTTPVAHGVDCRDPLTGVDDPACAAANNTANGTNGTITTPWLTANFKDGVGHSLRTGELFEGGLDLTAKGLGGRCFNTFIGDTRSSQELTATLFDYARGVLGECTSDIVTTPQTGTGGSIGPGGLSIGTGSVVVQDHAVITVDGADEFDGTVTFSLCGPFALNNTTTNCATGGVQIGLPVAVDELNTAVDSADTTLTSVGNYCWRAVFSGDAAAGVPGSSDPEPTDTTNRSECFKVNPVTPTLTTQASGDVLLGNAISDTATLTGTANQPGTDGIGPGGTINATNGAPAGGSITWNAYGPGGCSTLAFGPTSRDVSGDGTYPTATQTAVSFTPTVVGTYTFVASYSGSSPNTNATGLSPCPDPSGAEDVVVSGAASLATAQRWLPNDTAHITSPATTTLAGDVTFTLYNDGTCGEGEGTVQYGPIVKDVVTDGTGPANNRTVSTSNATFFITVTNDGTAWSWLVSYDDDALADPDPVCESTTPAFTLSD